MPNIDRAEALKIAERAKKRKFGWAGSILTLVGILLISIGLLLHTGADSSEGFFVAVGIVVVIIGLLMLLIGLINPITPKQL